MILIITQRDNEPSTLDVQNWLDFYDAEYIRINGEDVIENFSFSPGLESNYDKILEKVNVVWFRRWIDINNRYETRKVVFPREVEPTPANRLRMHDYLGQEMRMVNTLFFRLLKDKFWFSHPSDMNHDKIKVLEVAKGIGLHIPESLVTTRKSDLRKFKDAHGSIITKNLREVQFFLSEQMYGSTKTIEVTNALIDEVSDSFFPSFFQAMILKEYELRVFYLDKKFYPMAIFSQLDEQTQIDFRNYNNERPNRNVPYILDDETCMRLEELMKALDLKTGSIDLIKSTDGKYYFLEVNPIGQFGMTSAPCNYHIEKIIAEYLMAKDTEIEKSKIN